MMSQQTINLGTADRGNGDPLRVAFDKVNDNFTELYNGVIATGVVSTSASPPVSPSVGDLWWDTNDGNLYVYYSGVWASANAGLQGPQGVQGAVGPAGIRGLKGNTGDIGPRGYTGETGAQGEVGPRGLKGDQGDPGAEGPKGDKGDTGEQGLQGLRGLKGDMGDQGPQGLKGDTGEAGPQGDRGFPGTQVQFSLTAPNPITEGNVWWDMNDGNLYVHYNNQWVSAVSIAGINSTDRLVNGASELVLDEMGFLTVPASIVLSEGVITFMGEADPGIVLGSSINSVFVRTLNGIDQYEWKFGTDGSLTLPSDLHGAEVFLSGEQPEPIVIGHTLNITPAPNASDKKFGFRIDQSDGAFTDAQLEMPTAENNKLVSISFALTDAIGGNSVGYIWNQGTDSNVTSLNNAFNIFANGTNIKLTAQDNSSNKSTWTFGNDSSLTFPDGTNTTGKGITVPVDQSLTVNTSYSMGPGGATTFKINPESIKLPTGNGTIFSGTEIAANSWGLDSANKTLYFPDAGDGVFPQIRYSTAGNDGMQLFTAAKPIKITTASNTHWTFGTTGNLTLPASGDVVDSTSVSQLAKRIEGSWTVTAGTNTYSFTVPADGTYTMWVKGNIPNGIITWNATLSISNTNVPAIGTQYAWNYTGGGSPILLTSIPNQIKGVAGTISTDATYSGTTSNRFDFGISNTSGSSQTIYYGWIKI
jgi:hypothetical protein